MGVKKQSSLHRFLADTYCYAFFNSLVVFYPVYALLFADHDISDGGMTVLFIIWSLGTVAMQLPILSLANKLSRKTIMVVGQMGKLMCFLVWITWPTFWGFLIGFLLWSVQWAVYNAVYEAIVYDELCARQHRKVYTKVCGRKSAIENVAYLAAASGSLMLPLGYNFIAYASVAAMLLSMLFAMRMDLRFVLPARERKVKMAKTLRATAGVIRRAPYILYLIILCNLLYGFSQIDEYLGLIGVEMGINPQFVGGLFIVATLCQILGGAVADKFEWISDTKLFAGVSVVGAMIVLLSIFFSVPGLIFLGLFYFFYAVIRVLVYARFQHAVPSAGRSVFLSFYSFFEQAACILSYVVMGVGAMTGGGYRFSVLLAGILTILVGLWAIAYIPGKKELYSRLVSVRKSVAANNFSLS